MIPDRLTALLGRLDEDYGLLTGSIEEQLAKTKAAELAAVEKTHADEVVVSVNSLVESDKAKLIDFITHYPDGPESEPTPKPGNDTAMAMGVSFAPAAPRDHPFVQRLIGKLIHTELIRRGKSGAQADAIVAAADAGGLQGLLEWIMANMPAILAAVMKIIALFGGA